MQQEAGVEGSGGRRRLKTAATTVVAAIVLFLVACAATLYTYDDSGAPALTTKDFKKFPLNFLVVGDWGREGAFNQTLVAKQVRFRTNYGNCT